MQATRILIVDDDRSQAESLRRVLALEGFQAHAVFSPEDAITEVAMRKPDAVISDFRMGGMNGFELYQNLAAKHPNLLFILATGYGSLETAVQALRAGVHDFLTKPIDTDELIVKLRKALQFKSLENQNESLRQQLGQEVTIIAKSQNMLDVLASVEKIADSAATVLINGESGTGKELIAKSIHNKSPRCAEPYIKVNCAAIPENLLESELFGHEEGAFTGAIARRQGKFEAANGGTIFLDEIGEMPLHLQPKLLRVLQEREFERVGGNQALPLDVRVVAATNRNLSELVEEGTFRSDLFYRLNVIPIELPALRDRLEDVIPLAAHFLTKFCDKNGRNLNALSEEVAAALINHDWPGNVRELENCMERAVVLASGDELGVSDFFFSEEESIANVSSVLEQLMGTDLSLDDLERRLILGALERCDGNVSQTARILGMTRRSLQYRVEKIRSGRKNGDEEGD